MVALALLAFVLHANIALPLLWKAFAERDFDKLSNMMQILYGSMLVAQNLAIYFTPRMLFYFNLRQRGYGINEVFRYYKADSVAKGAGRHTVERHSGVTLSGQPLAKSGRSHGHELTAKQIKGRLAGVL